MMPAATETGRYATTGVRPTVPEQRMRMTGDQGLCLSNLAVRTLFACILGATFQASIHPAHAQSDSRLRSQIIRVFDSQSGQPLSDAIVLDVLTGKYVKTAGRGTASLNFVTFRSDSELIEVRKVGFQPKRLFVRQADTASITAALDRVTALPVVVTREKYRIDQDSGRWEGFEERCQSKSVTCFRPQDLKSHPNRNIADLLIKADGVMVGSCAKLLTISGGRGVVESGANARNSQCGNVAMHPSAGPGSCQPTFFVDGFEWDSHLGTPIDIQPGSAPVGPYTAANVKAIEVYSTEKARPLAFEGDYSCGVVVLWTK
jgi:hypothetical protein